MPSLTHALSLVSAVWRISRGQPDSIRHIDVSAEGFWHSFSALLFSLPFFIVISSADWRLLQSMGSEIRFTPFFTIELVAYALSWALFPLAMIPVMRRLGLIGNYVPFIICYNWGNLITIAAMTVPYVLLSLGAPLGGIISLLIVLALFFSVWFRYALIRATLTQSIPIAGGIILIDWGVGVLTDWGATLVEKAASGLF